MSPALSSLLLTSSGIPSLDDVLGGGIQLGSSLTILNPDPHSAHTDLLQKYFIAQGLLSGHKVYVADAEAHDLVNSCMWCPASATSVLTDDEGARVDDTGVVDANDISIPESQTAHAVVIPVEHHYRPSIGSRLNDIGSVACVVSTVVDS